MIHQITIYVCVPGFKKGACDPHVWMEYLFYCRSWTTMAQFPFCLWDMSDDQGLLEGESVRGHRCLLQQGVRTPCGHARILGLCYLETVPQPVFFNATLMCWSSTKLLERSLYHFLFLVMLVLMAMQETLITGAEISQAHSRANIGKMQGLWRW